MIMTTIAPLKKGLKFASEFCKSVLNHTKDIPSLFKKDCCDSEFFIASYELLFLLCTPHSAMNIDYDLAYWIKPV